MLAAWIFLKGESIAHFSANWVRVLGAVAVLLALYVNGVVLRHTVLLGEWQSESNWHEHHIYEAILWSVVLLVLVLTRPLFYRVIANSALSGCREAVLFIVSLACAYFILRHLPHEGAHWGGLFGVGIGLFTDVCRFVTQLNGVAFNVQIYRAARP